MANFDENNLVYVDASEVIYDFYDLTKYIRSKSRKYMRNSCVELEEYMKRNAPWNDRTGEARRNLKAEFIDDFTPDRFKEFSIKLSHGVSYGVFLEYNGEFNPAYKSRRRPILVPTLNKKVPEVIQGLIDVFTAYKAYRKKKGYD
ncbi:MAG: hypothetical protein J6T10_22685 [Methanobrevibacter sp.]|nr:hypothetical protein [Methanobrevibacter sp.]